MNTPASPSTELVAITPTFEYDLSEYVFDRHSLECLDNLSMRDMGRIALKTSEEDIVVWHGAWSVRRPEMPVLVACVDRPYVSHDESTNWFFGVAPMPSKRSITRDTYFVDYATYPAENIRLAVQGAALLLDNRGRRWHNSVKNEY